MPFSMFTIIFNHWIMKLVLFQLLKDPSITGQINKNVNFQWLKIIFYSTLTLYSLILNLFIRSTSSTKTIRTRLCRKCVIKASTRLWTKLFANSLCTKSAYVWWDWEHALHHLWIVHIPFITDHNLLFSWANTKGTLCTVWTGFFIFANHTLVPAFFSIWTGRCLLSAYWNYGSPRIHRKLIYCAPSVNFTWTTQCDQGAHICIKFHIMSTRLRFYISSKAHVIAQAVMQMTRISDGKYQRK